MRLGNFILIAFPVAALGGIALSQGKPEKLPGAPAPVSTYVQSATRQMPAFADRYRTYDRGRWSVSDGWKDGEFMINDWRATQARFGRGLELTLEQRKTDKADFTSGAVQSTATYGYGYYETAMRAAAGSGVVSALFTYTGPYFGDPWDEIDIEVIGRKPREVMFTYFTDGKKESKVVALAYDATQEVHVYGFDWQPGWIRWYIDGELKHEVLGATIPLPTHRQKIVTSVWASNTLTDWLGPFETASLPTHATFRCVSYSARYGQGPSCRDNAN